jgi:hypothetical protein
MSTLEEQVADLQKQVQTLQQQLQQLQAQNGSTPTGITKTTSVSPSDPGSLLSQYMRFDNPIIEPTSLDSAVKWERKFAKETDPSRPYTHEILSLIAEHDRPNSYMWPLYIELRATNHPDATQKSSQSTGALVRSYNRGKNGAWVVSYHTDLFHGQDFDDKLPPVPTQGTSIGVNVELTRKSAGGTAIGVLAMATDASEYAGTDAILITGRWNNGVHVATAHESSAAINLGNDKKRAPVGSRGLWISGSYDVGIDMGDNEIRANAREFKAAINLGNDKASVPMGSRGLWISGSYDMGIDMGNNCIRMNKGAELCFEETRRFYMKYNAEKNRIEFHNRGEGEDRVIGYIPANAPEHEL